MKKKYEKAEILDLWNTYTVMLGHQERQEKYSKTKYRNNHLERYEGRTRGSYEAFMMNISTARDKHGLPVLKGYKPSMPNYNRYLDKICKMTLGIKDTPPQRIRYVANCIEAGELFSTTFISVKTDPRELKREGMELAAGWGGECISVQKDTNQENLDKDE